MDARMHGGQVCPGSFYQIPRQIFTDRRCQGLSSGAKLLYALLRDRAALSRRNGWVDGQGRVFIYFTIREVEQALGCSHGTAVALMGAVARAGLIERVRQGQGRPSRIYVSGGTDPEEDRPGPEERPSRPGGPPERRAAPAQARALRAAVEEQIDYPLLCRQFPPELVDELTGLICEVMDPACPDLRVNGARMPAGQVRDRFRRLAYDHIGYVLDCLCTQRQPVHSTRAFLLTALYNAPNTMNCYYQAQARRDMLG